METVANFIVLGSQITADGDCSHEIKRCLLLERKGMIKLDTMLKCRDIILPTNSVQSRLWFFQKLCETWTINKAERQRIDAFEL